MWWNIIPSWVITGSCLYIPVVATLGSSYFWLGSIYGRERDSDLHRFLIFRDKRILNGANPYRQHKHLGLDGIPDN